MFTEGNGPFYSYDNPNIHKGAKLDTLGINVATDRVPLPPWSGDFHQVIEHIHGIMTKHYQEDMLVNPQRKTATAHMQAFKELFLSKTVVTQRGVADDVKHLHYKFYPLVCQKKGQYPHHSFM